MFELIIITTLRTCNQYNSDLLFTVNISSCTEFFEVCLQELFIVFSDFIAICKSLCGMPEMGEKSSGNKVKKSKNELFRTSLGYYLKQKSFVVNIKKTNIT